MDAVSVEYNRVLGSPEAGTWPEQLAAVLHNREAKDSLVRLIREAATRMLGEVADDEREAVLKAVVTDVVRRAKLLAIPRPAPPEIVPLRTGADLEDRIIGDYPAPIAVPYRAMIEEHDEAGSSAAFSTHSRRPIHFLATIAVSAYFRTNLSNVACNKLLLPQLLKARWSAGQILGLLREVIRHAGDCGGLLPYPELPGHLFRPNGKPTDSLETLESFVELRNDSWGHATGRTGKYYAGLFERVSPDLDRELAQMDWLAGWHLIRPVKIDADRRVVLADQFVGERPRFKRTVRGPQILSEDLPDHDGDIRIDRDALLFRRGFE